MKILSVSFGCLFFFISLILAFVYKYNHFYEFSLIGLLLIVTYFSQKEDFRRKDLLFLYLGFSVLGFLIDFSAQLVKFWHYSYGSFLEYLVLYLLIYPLGGLVMLFTYFLVKSKIHLNKAKNRELSPYLLLKLFVFSIFIFTLLTALTILSVLSFSASIFFIAGSFIFILLFAISYFSEVLIKKSVIRDFMENPLNVLTVVLISTYINMPIHEFPNSFASEWIYTIHTNSFLDASLLNLSLIVWLGWPLLVLGPLSMYYFTKGVLKHV